MVKGERKSPSVSPSKQKSMTPKKRQLAASTSVKRQHILKPPVSKPKAISRKINK
jgi:hypothetical protein